MVHIYFTPDVRDQIVAAQPANQTNTEYVLAAVETHHKTLRELYLPAEPRQGGLFDRGVLRTNKRMKRPTGSPKLVQYGARLHSSHIRVIDSLVDDLPISRSAFLAAALQLHATGQIVRTA